MLGVSFGEIVLVVLLAIIFIKPDDIPVLFAKAHSFVSFLSKEIEKLKASFFDGLPMEDMSQKEVKSIIDLIEVKDKNKDVQKS